MIKKPHLPLLVLVVLLLACLSPKAVTPPITETADQGKPTPEIVIRFATDEWEHGRYEDLIQAFEAENPGWEVKLVSTDEVLGWSGEDRSWSDDAWVRLASAVDVIKLQPGEADVQPGLVRDLTSLIEADPAFDLQDFYPGALAGCQDPGGIWCLPTVLHGYLFFYDKDAFDRRGVPYPEPGWTWDDLLSKAAALTERQRDGVKQWGTMLRSLEYLPFVESQVGPLLDMTTDPPTLRFDQPEVIRAVRWFADLSSKHEAARSFVDEEAGLAESLIDRKEVAMWPYEYGIWNWLSEQRNVGIAPFPTADTDRDRASTPIWAYDWLAISAGTAHPDAARQWLKAVSEAAGGRSLVPARRSVADASGFWNRADPELASALRYALEHGFGTRWSPASYQTLREAPGYRAFYDAVEAILSGGASVEDALARAQVEARTAIRAEIDRQARASPVPTVAVTAGDSEQARTDAVTIVFASDAFRSIQPNALQPYRELADRFQETHPQIIVEVKLLASPSGPTMQNVAQGADCFSWTPSFDQPGSLEAILSLEPFLETDPSFTTDDFYPALLEPFVREGELWGLPSQARPEVIKYNKDLIAAAGLDNPAVDWTTDDFLELAIALTRGEGEQKQYGFVGSPFEHTLLWMVERRGADLVDMTADPPTMALNDPSTVEALRWYVDLSAVYGVKPVFITDLSRLPELGSTVYAEWVGLIGSGRAGMWTIVESLELVHDPEGLNVGLATLPSAPGSAAGAYQYVYGYFIAAHTEAGHACWEWITYLTGQPEAVWSVPARRSVVESEAYRQLVGAERAAVYEASVAGASRAPSYQLADDQGWLAPGLFWLFRAYGQVVEGEASAEEALDAAQRTFDEYRACVAARDVVSDASGWGACLQEIDPALAEMMPDS